MTLGIFGRSQLEGLLRYPVRCEAASRSSSESLRLRDDKRLYSPMELSNLTRRAGSKKGAAKIPK